MTFTPFATRTNQTLRERDVAAIEQVPAPEKSFDLVNAIMVMEYVQNPRGVRSPNLSTGPAKERSRRISGRIRKEPREGLDAVVSLRTTCFQNFHDHDGIITNATRFQTPRSVQQSVCSDLQSAQITKVGSRPRNPSRLRASEGLNTTVTCSTAWPCVENTGIAAPVGVVPVGVAGRRASPVFRRQSGFVTLYNPPTQVKQVENEV